MIVEILITLLIIFLVYASCNIRSNIYLKVFCKKQTEEKIVAITFDDGPDPIQTPKVLQVLKEQQIPACFFCIGHKVQENEELIRQIINEGHLIGNHSFTHTNHFPLYSLSRMKKDLQACQFALERVTSQKIKLFRPPFGVTNPTIAKAVRILGYTPVGWNIRTLDTLQLSKEKVLKHIQLSDWTACYKSIMRTILIILSIILGISYTHAQTMKKLIHTQDFENRLAKEAQAMQSIESDFTQVKYLDILDEKVTSKGKFYYQKSGKIRMEYAQPVNYLIVINDSRLKIVSDGKKSVMSLTANKMMNQMQDMLTACMIGDLSKMSSDYKLEYFENDSYYIVKIKPVNKAIQAYISEIEIYLDKKDMSVYKLRLSETATNYTEYEFYNKRFNALKDETKFSIR